MTVKTKNLTKATKARRTRPPRRLLGKPDYIPKDESPTELDVVGGRGGGSNHHVGNKRYWERILDLRERYKRLGKTDDDEKTAMAQSIMDFISNSNGRFLQKEAKTGLWFILPPRIVLEKIKQALRDKYIPLFARGSMNAREILKACNFKSSDSIRTLNSLDIEGILKPTLNDMSVSKPNSFSSSDDLKMHIENLPSLNLSDFLKSYKSSDMQGEFTRSTLMSSESFRTFSSMGFHGSSNQPFNDRSLSKTNNFTSTDDLKMEIGKLPIFLNETSRGSLSLLTGHSLDLMASLDRNAFSSDKNSSDNPCAVPKKIESWYAKYEQEVASPFPVSKRCEV